MKKTKKIVALVIALVMVFAVTAVLLAACDGGKEFGNGGEYNITVWVSESNGVKEQIEAQIAKFNETNDRGYTFNATVEGVSESESATQMITSVEDGADIFCFAQDQTARLVQAGALSQPGKQATKEIKEGNDAGSVKAATVGGIIRAYPLTADNGYFMLYDKRYIKESSLDDLASIVADCEAAGKNFSFEISSSAWYTASFFFATGCHSDWIINEDGKATGIDDDFNSAAGITAMKGMQILTKSSRYVASSSAGDFAAGVPSAVVITGTWAIDEARKALGENLGMTDLPSFTVDGKSYHLGSYSGYKLMGVKPQTDANKAAGLSLLARYLTNEENQLERFNSFNWGPSNLKAQQDNAVKANEGLSALALQSAYATPQGVIDGTWWDIAKLLGEATIKATSEADLQAALDAYDAQIQASIDRDPEALRRWSVIGGAESLGGEWKEDYSMTEGPDNTWTSNQAFEFKAGDEFKCRQGGSWDLSFGNGGNNFVVEDAGTYKVQLVLTVDGDGNITGGTITLIPAE